MILKYFSVIIMPMVFVLILMYGFFKKVDVFSAFLEGAKDGLKTLFGILPALIGLMAAISMFRSSGALQFLTGLLSPVTNLLGIPTEIMPLALLRPVSGSGSLALVNDLFKTIGPDSMAGRIASVIMGSTETTFYTLAIYYGSVNLRHTRHTVPAALLADATGILAGTFICLLFYH